MTKTPTKQRPVEVVQVEGAEVPAKIIAQAIVDISKSAKTLLNGPLNKRALILLIQDAAGGQVGKRDIELILNCLISLETLYVKRPVQK